MQISVATSKALIILPNKILFTQQQQKKMGVPKGVQGNHSFCNHYSKEQNLCCRAALFLRARSVFRFHTTWYFLKLLDLKPAAKAQSTGAVMAVTRCQDQFCPRPSPFGREPQNPPAA